MNKTTFFIYFSLLLLIACGPSSPEDRFKAKTDAEKDEKLVDLTVKRLDVDFFKLDTTNANAQIDSLSKKYDSFWDLYLFEITGVAMPDDPTLDTKILKYTGDGFVQSVVAETKKTFPDLNSFLPDLQLGFTRYQNFFPGKKLPAVVTYIAPFYKPVLATDGEVAIELDRFLGRKHGFYTEHPDFFPQYSLVGSSKEYIASSALYSWVVTEFDSNSKTMLDTIIHNGKALFLLDALLPNVPDSIKMRYTTKQLEWCKNSEGMIWSHFVDKKLLYTSDGKTIKQYTDEAPFTKGMPKESPGRTGNWLGWQIVKAYMAKNNKLTMEDLFKENNAQKILSASGYRPKTQ